MIEPIDIYRTAKLLIDRHGDLAAIEAATRVDEMTAKGDMDGRRTWLDVLKAIDELQGVTPGETKH
jgi:hypothetical protein